MNYRIISLWFFIGMIYFLNLQECFAQYVLIRAGANYQFHLKGTSDENPDIPEEYQESIERPSIYKFFKNSGAIDIGLTYRSEFDSSRWAFIGQFNYEHTELDNKLEDAKDILGQSIEIQTFSFLGGSGLHSGEKRQIFVYWLAGYAYKKYEGKGKIEDIKIKYNYQSGNFLRLCCGVENEDIFNIPISIGVGIKFDIGTVERDEVEFYYESEKIGRLVPVGDLELQDNQISLFDTLNYKFNLFNLF